MKKRAKNFKIKKQTISSFKAIEINGGADEFTRPFRMCMLSFKDIDCKPIKPIDLTLPTPN